MYTSLIEKIDGIAREKSDLAVTTICSDPIEMISISNFLSPNECKYLCKKIKSLNTTNLYVSVYQDDVIKTIALRLASFLDIPVSNMEYMMLAKFVRHTQYAVVTDSSADIKPTLENETSEFQQWSPSGKRMFSCTIFLNDDFEGGFVQYNDADVYVKPEIGKLVIVNLLNKNNEPVNKDSYNHTSVNKNKFIAHLCVREKSRFRAKAKEPDEIKL